MRPAAHLLFLRRQEKKAKEGDPQSATPSLRYGANLQRCACGVRRGTRFAAAQRRSDSHGESDHEAWAHGRPCHPATAPPQAQPAGGEQPNSHSGRRCARPQKGCALRKVLAPTTKGRAKQRPVWMFCSPCPSGCAEERRVWRIRARDCLSEVKRSEFERDPARPEHRRLPRSEAQGTQTVGSPFLWFLSFGDAKERNPDAGRLPTSALHQSMPLTGHTVLCMDGGHFKKHSYQRISH